MTTQTILPVLLGTDANAYGMARSFHEAYGIRSLALGKFPLLETKHSHILKVKTFENFDQPEVFLKVLKQLANNYQHKYEHMILIACGDRYAELVSSYKEILSQDFHVPYVDNTLRLQLEDKEKFYTTCENYGLDYPKTFVITKANQNNYEVPFAFPVAAKASDSITYVNLDFPGKKKSYKADSPEELQAIVKKVYDAGYEGSFIVQDFIPGDDATMFVLNSYSDANGKVRAMCLGQCVLEDYTPEGIGNYNAIIQKAVPEVYDTYRRFLEAIHFVGFSNFDMKYDERDKTYKVFEINIRQGRSSFFTTASGCNLVTYLVEDLIEKEAASETYYHNNPSLWRHVPKQILKKYSPARVQKEINGLLAEGNDTTTLLYKKDRNPYREIFIRRFYAKSYGKYQRYFNKRNLND